MKTYSFVDRRRLGKFLLLAVALALIVTFLLISNSIVKQLAHQERERMNIWAEATERLASTETNTDFEFLLGIIRQNNSIPVLVADHNGNVVEFRNFNLPDKNDKDKFSFYDISEENRNYLNSRLERMTGGRKIADAATS